MTRGALALLALVACGSPRSKAPAAAAIPSPARVDAGVADMTPAAGDAVPTLDELAARGATDAPLMREVKRVDDASAPTAVEAGTSDACFRAAVASSAPIRAWFIDASNAARGELADAAGPVPPRGPVCARKGETLRLVVHAPTAGTTVRAVIWQSP